MMDRIALFSPTLVGGGAERVMLNLANGFVEYDYSVDLVLSSAEGELIGQLDKRVRLIDLKSRRVATCMPGLIKYLISQSPKALLSTMGHANVIAVAAAMFPGVRTRVIVRDTYSPVGAATTQPSTWSKFVDWLARFAYSRADGVVAVCNDVKPQIASKRSLSLDRVSVIYNPVHIDSVRRKAKEPSGHEWFDNASIPVIVSVGRLSEEKDFASLIRGFALVCRETDARLVILGEGELRDELLELALSLGVSDKVDLPGFVQNPYSYVSRAKVFVLSSLTEGLPNALLESLALGTPIVATDCQTGPREILRDGKDGILVPIHDPEALAHGVLSSLKAQNSSPVEPESLARFDHSSVINQYLDLMCPGR